MRKSRVSSKIRMQIYFIKITHNKIQNLEKKDHKLIRILVHLLHNFTCFGNTKLNQLNQNISRLVSLNLKLNTYFINKQYESCLGQTQKLFYAFFKRITPIYNNGLEEEIKVLSENTKLNYKINTRLSYGFLKNRFQNCLLKKHLLNLYVKNWKVYFFKTQFHSENRKINAKQAITINELNLGPLKIRKM